jgi:hypothetical protein
VGLGIHWFFTYHQEDVKRNAFWQLRQADITYRDSAAPPWIRSACNCRTSTIRTSSRRCPTFWVGTDAGRANPRAEAPHRSAPPANTYVRVECIVEPTGPLKFLHIVEGLGPGYDEEVLRIVRLLSPFEPAIRHLVKTHARQALASVKEISVSFYH